MLGQASSLRSTRPPRRSLRSTRGMVWLGGLLVAMAGVDRCLGGLQIDLVFIGSQLTPAQESAFRDAEAFWESALLGYRPGISQSGVTIYASAATIDGPGGSIGQANPIQTGSNGGYFLTIDGMMSFDVADLPMLEGLGLLDEVLTHEMAHVLGFGFHWQANNVYQPGTGRYTGARGLAEYRQEFLGQEGAMFVPVELGGGGGTFDFHWDEVDFGAGLTQRVTHQGRDMRDELMTGWFNRQLPAFVSRTTLGQFEDLGFVANLGSVPEPSSGGLLVASLVLALRMRRKR